MIQLIRTNSTHPDFRELVKELDKELRIRDGEDHSFFAQFNKIDAINCVILAFDDQQAVGCGAIKEYADKVMEVKRMYVRPDERGKGIATQVLQELEKWCKELYFKKCILETGEKQPEAIKLYLKNNYTIIPNYGQYAEVESSVCFEKKISK
ncbi:GNAT family N-acetyltransferase [Sphingobacteriaceae bacterium]|nr:GNAT family N-acetyltransferase [Sphingobacteriaceae bacterium]